MTAEIAILNKTAIALATDSAVTISAGKKEQKIYDSADKLFELSFVNPIGIMIYNGMQFMEIPLQNIISDYRKRRKRFDRVPDAAMDFLAYLNEWDAVCSDDVKDNALRRLIGPILDRVRDRINDQIGKLLEDSTDSKNLPKEIRKIFVRNVLLFDKIFEERGRSEFVGGIAPRITRSRRERISDICEDYFNKKDEGLWENIVNIAVNVVLKKAAFGSHTGIVVAGFGNNDIFPTLLSFEIDGIVFGKLKYVKKNIVDIDRGADCARVLPFAQKEMVERFLYGLDSGIERNIRTFCRNTIPEISDKIISQFEVSDGELAKIKEEARKAEQIFLSSLQDVGFDEIRSDSRSAIEDMVEFMPKPELATMAEALVNLTSIKRRVSRGVETVGGPIDVAVISRSDGFIWVKRKHYFPAELNPRYAYRVQTDLRKGDGGE